MLLFPPFYTFVNGTIYYTFSVCFTSQCIPKRICLYEKFGEEQPMATKTKIDEDEAR